MTFEDVPDNLGELPLDDPTLIADVLDLFVTRQMCDDGALLVLICDQQRRLIQPMVIEDIEVCPPDDALLMLDNLVQPLTQVRGATLLIALARPGRLSVCACDIGWAEVIGTACAGRVELIGMHLVTASGSLPIARPAAGPSTVSA
ncbi:MAG TPA: hypothetical protein PLT68_04150 [Actinomycetota bacterium]|nr:hypothetical protein [Actinomycetota bacterium]